MSELQSDGACHADPSVAPLGCTQHHNYKSTWIQRETQLIATIHDWAETINAKGQTDAILLDFSKAFDKVPHKRLAVKLQSYGITSKTLNWIEAFSSRSQNVSVNGVHSSTISVMSGVLQGSVIGPALLLLYINDIKDNIRSSLRLFTDDSIVYRDIRSDEDSEILQQDLDTLERWAQTWQMDFNMSKCYHLTLTRKWARLLVSTPWRDKP